MKTAHRNPAHHRGVMAGLFLVLSIAVAGFLLQGDMAKVFQGGGRGLIIFGIMIVAALTIVARSRPRP